MESLIVVLMFIVSLAFSGLVCAALITYVRRTWQLIRSESDQSMQYRILDGIDQLQTRLDVLTERVDGLERRLPPGDARREIETPHEREETE